MKSTANFHKTKNENFAFLIFKQDKAVSNPRLITSHGNAERRFYKVFRNLRLLVKDVCTVSKSRHYSVARTKSQGFTKISECLFLGLLKYSPKSKKFTPKTLDIFLNLWYVVVAKNKTKEENNAK